MVAVAQNVQARVHPDWEETQTVPRVREGMRTVSVLCPSPNSMTHFVVPSSARSIAATRAWGRTSEARRGPRIDSATPGIFKGRAFKGPARSVRRKAAPRASLSRRGLRSLTVAASASILVFLTLQ
jgi:hypothetical protein